MPDEARAEPYLFCTGCRRKFRFGPFFGRHPECRCPPGSAGWTEVRYDRLRLKTEPRAAPLTPLLIPGRLAGRLGLSRLRLKNESVLPTHSWKDRVNEVHARLATQWKFGKVATISTGNHGISLAAQARRYGLACRIFVHADCPAFTRQIMRHLGAELTPYQEEPHVKLRQLSERERVYPAVSLPWMDGVANAYGAEGYKRIAEELAGALIPGKDNWVIIPAGIGDGVFGIWKGFCELRQLGVIRRMPRVVAAQGRDCASLVRALRNGWKIPRRIHNPRGIGLSIREPWSGPHALAAVRASRGTGVGVADRAMVRAMGWLADEGLLIEPASAATVAAADELAQAGKIGKADGVFCILTGSAVKWAGAPWWRG